MMTALMILILCADISTTWFLLVNYGKMVKENAVVASWFFRKKFYGHLLFICIRIVLLAVFATWASFWGQATWCIITGYAVVNNLIVIRRLHG